MSDNTFVTGARQTLHNVHSRDICLGRRALGGNCPIHRPSERAEAIGPTEWVPGGGMHRRCEHGYLHPDPDVEPPPTMGNMIAVEAAYSVHLMEENCDGCCR